MKKRIFLFLALISMAGYSHTNAQGITGDWFGEINLGGPTLTIELHISDSLGYLQGSMDSPKQGAYGIVLDTVYMLEDSLYAEINQLKASFVGGVNSIGNRIEGRFLQNGFVFPLKLGREAIKEDPNRRPQDPTSIDYYSEDLFFFNAVDTVRLAGTLTMPFDPNIKKAVLLISGSGPQNRNEEVKAFNHRPFLVLSDYLTKQGIAVLRYDDRGVGLSSGNYAGSTTENFKRDALAGIEYLKNRSDLDGAEVGVIGHSEGGIIAAMLEDSLDFMVLLGTPAVPSTELLMEQSLGLSKVAGVPDSIIQINLAMNSEVYSFLLNNSELTNAACLDSLAPIFKKYYSLYPAESIAQIPDFEAFARRQASSVANNWFRYFIAIKPSVYLSKATLPVLGITGTLDLQVPYGSNLAAMEEALKSAGNTQYEVYAFQGLNHLFQTAITGAVNEYGILTETFNEEVMIEIAKWINALP